MQISSILIITAVLLLFVWIAVKQKLRKSIPFLLAIYFVYVGYEAFAPSVSDRSDRSRTVVSDTIRHEPVPEVSISPVLEDTSASPASEAQELDVLVEEEAAAGEPSDTLETVSVPESAREMAIESAMSIKYFVFCEEVTNDRQVIRPAREFANDVDTVYCFTAIENPGDSSFVTHIWYYEQSRMVAVPMPVGRSGYWRTWSTKTIPPEWIGLWRVEVLDPQGIKIGSKEFRVVRKETGD